MSSRLTLFTIASLVIAGCARDAGSTASADSAAIQGPTRSAVAASTPTLPDSAEAEAILRFLKRMAPADEFSDSLIKPVPVDSLLALVSDCGLVSVDINLGDDSATVVPPTELRTQLTTRHGGAFSQLGHLAYIASQPYPQYSGLEFTREEGTLIVEVGDWYVLTYVSERGRTRLRRVSYLQSEGE